MTTFQSFKVGLSPSKKIVLLACLKALKMMKNAYFTLKVQECRFQNLPICSDPFKNHILKSFLRILNPNKSRVIYPRSLRFS